MLNFQPAAEIGDRVGISVNTDELLEEELAAFQVGVFEVRNRLWSEELMDVFGDDFGRKLFAL